MSNKINSGFTLVEMLVAVAVFALLALMVTQLLGGASFAINGARKSMDADRQARLVFSRMAHDFSGILNRPDADVIFAKQQGNDKMFFYSEAPGYYDATNGSLFPSTNDPKNSVSLLGYTVGPDPKDATTLQLFRLGRGLTWDESANTDPGSVVFLTIGNSTQSYAINPSTTLDGHWPTVLGSSPNYQATDTKDYHAIGDQIFRFEYCFLLNDGTYSNYPVKKLTVNNNSNYNNLNASSAPSSSNGYPSYVTGSRWFNASSGRGYLCLSAPNVTGTAGAAIWGGAGVQDISAIVVTIAILDTTSRKMVSNMANLPSIFKDVTDGDLGGTNANSAKLMEQNWKATMNQQGFADTAGIPPLAASQIRIYQHYFYLSNPQ